MNCIAVSYTGVMGREKSLGHEKNDERNQAQDNRNGPRVATLVIGCGNLLRGDDAVGPEVIRRLRERDVPPGVQCADGGTNGVDIAFQMRGVPHLILVDACQSGSEPGTIFEVASEELEQLPTTRSINLHSFRWDHALAFGRWWLKDEFPLKTTVYLIEGADFQVGMKLTPAVDRAIDLLVEKMIGMITTDTVVGR